VRGYHRITAYGDFLKMSRSRPGYDCLERFHKPCLHSTTRSITCWRAPVICAHSMAVLLEVHIR